MKLRNHISPVVCLVVAIVSHWSGSAAVAQQALPVSPFMPPARQSCLSDRFYIQGGAQYRAIQRFGFEKKNHVIRYAEPVQDPHNPGVYYTEGRPPFGPNRSGDFGTGTGVPGYQEFGPPTGRCDDNPRRSGIWMYDDGNINPNGRTSDDPSAPTLWPNNPFQFTPQPLLGLGQYRTSGDGVDVGVIYVKSTSLQVTNGYAGIYQNQPDSMGFDPANPPLKNATWGIVWTRVMDDSVAVFPEQGVPSAIWRTLGAEIRNLEYNEQVWAPTFEFGFQYTNLFDIFYGFSWFNLEKTLSRSFNLRGELWRRGYKDTFPFWSDDSGNWAVGSWHSDVRPDSQNVNQQIVPDGQGTGGYPHRTFFEQPDPRGTAQLPAVTVIETIGCRTDAAVYENRLGFRSWTPLYGMGRFGVTLGPLMNLIYYRASQNTREDFVGGVSHVDNRATLNEGWLLSYGFFTAADVEIDFSGFFFRTNAQYSLSEEKALKNSEYTSTNLNVSGFSSILVGGVRF